MNKNAKILSFLVVTLLVIATISVVAGVFTESEDKEIVLVTLDRENDVSRIRAAGLEVLEVYPNYALVELSRSEEKDLNSMGIRVDNRLPSRTELFVKGHRFDIMDGLPEFSDELTIENYEPGTEGLYIVHTLGPVHPNWRADLEKAGVEVVNYVPNYAYEVRMTPEEASLVSELDFVDWVGIYQPGFKLAENLETGTVSIRLVDGFDRHILNDIRSNVNIISVTDLATYGTNIIAEVRDQAVFTELARHPDVYYISNYAEPQLLDEMATQIIAGGLWVWDPDDDPYNPWRGHSNEFDHGAHVNHLGWTGDGLTVAVADTGINPDHLDFQDRVIGGYYWSGNSWVDEHGHGSHCAGSIAGNTYDGTGTTVDQFGVINNLGPFYAAQGLAYDADLYSVRIFDGGGGWIGPNDYFEIIEVAAQNTDSYIHSNSWGTTVNLGAYLDSSEAYDAAVRDADRGTGNNEPMVVVVAAGNDGPGQNTVGAPATAKNVIGVGATENFMPEPDFIYVDNPDNVASFSSRGWTDDNRVKPDVMAPGEAIISTGEDGQDHYYGSSGTSMACPAVAGAATLTVEWYEDTYGYTPSPAMVRALLINTAYDLDDDNGNTGPIPNRDEGWGMVNLPALMDAPSSFTVEDQNSLLTTGSVDEFMIQYEDDSEPLKISLTWTDKEASAGETYVLKNDLDLEVVSPGGDVYRGNAFSGGWTQPNQDTMSDFDTAGDGWDDVNNVENVYIHPGQLESGTYTVRIIGANIPEDANNDGSPNQDYALVMYNAMDEIPGVPPEITVTRPDGGETFTAGTQEDITWTTQEGDDPIDHVDLWYSTDNGDNWVSIDTGISDTGSYTWTVPNEHSSESLVRARVRDTAGRSFEDVSDDVFDIVGIPPEAPQNLVVEHYGEDFGIIFEDDVEGGDLGYTTGESGGTDEWEILQNGAAVGSSSWDFGDGNYADPPNGGRSWLISPEIDLTGATDAELSFQHWRDFEDSGTLWDGGNLKISTEGVDGPFELIEDPSPGYDGSIAGGYNNPLAGQPGWGHEENYWEEVTVDLSDYDDQTIWIQWDVGLDDWGTTHEGWRIDDIMVTANIPDPDGDDHNLLTWDASSDDPDEVSHYNIYRSEDQNGPWDGDTLIDTVAAHGSPQYQYMDTDRGMADEIYWWYVVRAVGVNGVEEENEDAVQEPGGVDPASISLTSPTGGEQWYANTQEDITWDTAAGQGDIIGIDIEYSVDGGGTWSEIAMGTADTGSYQWNVPDESTTEAVIRVTVHDDNDLSDSDSSGLFDMIGTPPEAPTDLTVEHYGAGEGGEEMLYPVVEISATNVQGDVEYLQYDPEDGAAYDNWYEQTAIADNELVVGLDVPSGELDGLQTIGVLVRRTDNSGRVPELTVELHQDGALIDTLLTEQGINDATGVVHYLEFQAGDLVDTSGSGLELHFSAPRSGGPVAERNVVEYGAVEWQANVLGGGGDGTEDNLLTWNASPDDDEKVTHYNIYRSEEETGPWDETAIIYTVDADGSADYSYVDPDAGTADDIRWWYVVRAVDMHGQTDGNEDAVQEPGEDLPTMEIELLADGPSGGWNFVSFNLDLEDDDLVNILEHAEYGISGNYDRVMYYDASTDGWYSYVPGRAEHFNNLELWDHTMGLWIRMIDDDMLTVQGSEPGETTLTLAPGWNMVGLPSSTDGNHDLPAEVTTVGRFDASEEYNIVYVDASGFIFSPGEGYWVYNNADHNVDWVVGY